MAAWRPWRSGLCTRLAARLSSGSVWARALALATWITSARSGVLAARPTLAPAPGHRAGSAPHTTRPQLRRPPNSAGPATRAPAPTSHYAQVSGPSCPRHAQDPQSTPDPQHLDPSTFQPKLTDQGSYSALPAATNGSTKPILALTRALSSPGGSWDSLIPLPCSPGPRACAPKGEHRNSPQPHPHPGTQILPPFQPRRPRGQHRVLGPVTEDTRLKAPPDSSANLSLSRDPDTRLSRAGSGQP